jgi:hypothetical protein
MIGDRHFGRWVLILGIVAAIAAASSPVAAGAEAARPSWQLNLFSGPTVFPRLGEYAPADENETYELIATDLGGAPTTGPITVVDPLPAGVEAVVEANKEPFIERASRGVPLPCAVAGSVVSCELPEEVASGESVQVQIPVRVSSSAADRVTNVMEVDGGGAAAVTASTVTEIGTRTLPFDLLEGRGGLFAQMSEAAGAFGGEAGTHPYQIAFDVTVPTEVLGAFSPTLQSVGELKDLRLSFPRGLYVNPNAVKAKCTERELENDLGTENGCPLSTQVGLAFNVLGVGPGGRAQPPVPVYAMYPAPGFPAELAFDAAVGVYVHLFGHVAADGEYEVVSTVSNIPGKLNLVSSVVSLWGDPTAASHDQMRGSGQRNGCIGLTVAEMIQKGLTCETERTHRSLLTLPSDCPSIPMSGSAEVSSWQEPMVHHQRAFPFTGLDGAPVSVTGCEKLEFAPTIASRPTTDHADSPTGLDFDLHQPQDEDFEGRATPNLRDAEVTLLEGVSVNPSSANGLAVCTEEEMGYQPQGGKIRFTETPQSCPDAAKIGTAEVSTPLLEHNLTGAIYVAAPYANPFDSLLSVYLALEDEGTGVISKLAGKVVADPATGQLTTTFTENPELPLEDIRLQFFDGPAAALKTGLTCGTSTTTSSLIPWSTPGGQTVHPTSTFETSVSASGEGACPRSEGGAPFAPTFGAGTLSPVSGAYSPFVLRLVRRDGEQHITGIDSTLPMGLLGKLAGIPYCPDAQIAAAQAREAPQHGASEQSNPSCPAASEVGSVTVGAGAGDSPYYVHGHAYLAGPYKGAPLSLVVIVPAVAGPYDLGTVVDRVALNIEQYDTKIHAVADPIPTIRDGIPLDVRSIELKLDRPSFTLNPTSCEAKQIEGSITSQAGRTTPVSNRFQVGDCGRLGFKPSLKLSLKGATKRTGHPALKAVVTYPKQGAYANIARAQVSLPHSEFLDQGNIGKSCTKPVLTAHACPAKSVYGKVKAWTPLLEKPLEGPVYLVGGFGYKLPALVAELNGQIRVLLIGKVDTDKAKGIRNTFEAVPDAPVERFVLEMKGGKKYGLLENSENICRKNQKAGVAFGAQNGKSLQKTVSISNSCSKSKKVKMANGRHGNRHKGGKKSK